jgi:AcrR family transcriptional regulator
MRKYSRAEQKALRPSQILEAAFEEFVEHGFKAARVEDIAKRIGVTKGTIYVYFPTKEHLFEAMVREISLPLRMIPAEILNTESTCTDQLRNLMRLLYERIMSDRKHREFLRFVIGEGLHFPEIMDTLYDEVMPPIFNLIDQLLEEGARRGEFRPAPAAMSSLIAAPILASTVEILISESRRRHDPAVIMEAHFDLILKSLV